MADLITQQYLADCLAGEGLTTTQTGMLPALAAAASRQIRKHCGRYFNRRTVDELLTAEPHSPLFLSDFPVNSVDRLATSPTAVLSVRNTDTATNQRATAALSTMGSVDAGLTVTGLTLKRWASGTLTTSAITFTSNQTVQSVAAAIVALSGGWTATAVSGYEKWPAADLRAVQGARPAYGSSAADFVIHVADLDFDLDADAGIVAIKAGPADPFGSIRFGPFLETDFGDQSVRGGFLGVRAVYDCGWDTVPEEVQQCAAELVKLMLNRLSTDMTLVSERAGNYAWQGRDMVGALPESARQTLALYRNVRA